MVKFEMFAFLNENLNFISVKLTSVLQEMLSIANFNLVNFNAANGSMLNHFERARASYNQNDEVFLTAGLVLLVSFIIGLGVYFLTHTKAKNKQ